MASPSRTTTALLTEHFRYTPLALIDDIINAVNTIVYRGIEAIETGLSKIPPAALGFPPNQSQNEGDGANTAAADEIEHGVHQLETLLEATVDKAFDKFEIYTLRNILTVPEDVAGWVRLRHYENLQFASPPTSLSLSDSQTHPLPTPETLLHLRRQLAETRKLNTALRSNHAQNAALLSDLRSLLSPPPPQTSSTNTTTDNHKSPPQPTTPSSTSLAFLTQPHFPPNSTSSPSPTTSLPLPPSTTPHHHQPPLTTTSQFLTSQLPALRTLVANLRPRLSKLQQQMQQQQPQNGSNLGGDVADDNNNNRDGQPGMRRRKEKKEKEKEEEERRRYIERGVERVLAGRGLDGGGELASRVERRGLEEVMDLERLVGGREGDGM